MAMSSFIVDDNEIPKWQCSVSFCSCSNGIIRNIFAPFHITNLKPVKTHKTPTR